MVKTLIKKHGAKNIAEHLNESLQTVVNWGIRGVPMEKARQFCEAVKFDITPHQLYPNQYPHPDDGLPDAMRSKNAERAA